MKEWKDKGCQECRRMWEAGQPLTELGVSQERHATLYQCTICGAYWEEFERFADIVTAEEAVKFYPGAKIK